MLLRVVYLDDEPDLLETFQETFSSDDIKVVTFADAQQAIEDVRNHPPDIIFLDYRLPDTTGDQVARSMDPKIPKAIITGELGLSAPPEVEVVFFKPYKTSDIEAFIHRVRQRRKT